MKTSAIVVLDDDAHIRGALESFLEAAGYEVDSYASAQGFLQSGRLTSASCLSLDAWMRGMSGVELLEHLERIGGRFPSSS